MRPSEDLGTADADRIARLEGEMAALVARQLETLECVRSLSRARDEAQRHRLLARHDLVHHQPGPNGKAHQGRQVGDA